MCDLVVRQLLKRMFQEPAGDGEAVGHGSGKATDRQGRGGSTELQRSEASWHSLHLLLCAALTALHVHR